MIFSKLNHPAHRYPCLRFERNLTASPARLEAKMESLSPFLWGSCIPYNMPVYPGAPRQNQRHELLQLGEFDLGLLEDRDVGVGVLPEREETFVRTLRLSVVS
jgi:hypothetical protein